MNLSHAKQQIRAKHSRHLWRVVDEDVRGLSDRSPLAHMPISDQACINAVAAGENSMISQAGRTYVAETPYFVGFRDSGSPSDGKIQRQNAEKNFTVRFTVKTIRWEAIDAIDAER
jgi:hypothetical protein